jgi:hypothetical protein
MSNRLIDTSRLISRLPPVTDVMPVVLANEQWPHYELFILCFSVALLLQTRLVIFAPDVFKIMLPLYSVGYGIVFPISKTIRHKNCYFCIPNILNDDQNRQSRN